ncbi:IS1595 family transposase [Rubellimicrobium rubrum]|uniref:IS1595 family transposase n=1 Tax=Rubellimicrobium rubrum TaxID=2585369 RepID=UPI00159B8CB4|nr:IS1595 family transposase [Rubellimicrobium rubrum]
MDRQRWGRTRTDVQRYRCKGCGRTWSGLTGTAVERIHLRGQFLDTLKDMMGDAPRSCRKLAKALGVSRHTAWRWRMRVLASLPGDSREILGGLVEADETFQRESRKGSREWVRHLRAPQIHPAPPRLRWQDYGRKGPPQAVVRQYQMPLLGIADREGRTALLRMPDTKQPSIEAALLPRIAPDVFLLSDGAPQYGAIAKAAGLGYWMLVAGRRSRITPATYHLNTVNGLHARWKTFRRPFCGPATKNLDGYARWMLARAEGYLPAFRRLLG